MYRWLRNTHLFLGLFSSLFVLMYGISSIRMAHISWFSTEPEITHRQIAIPPESAENARAVARHLMDEHGLQGEVGGGRQSETGFRFSIGRPGTFHLVEYSRESGEAKIETRVMGFVALLHHIHETAGLYHDYALLNIWGAFVGVVSSSLIVLACLSGRSKGNREPPTDDARSAFYGFTRLSPRGILRVPEPKTVD